MGRIIEAALAWCVDTANDPAHGYDQIDRWGPDYDCSSFVITAFKNAGIDTKGATNTRDMRAEFKKAGFIEVPLANRIRGDVLLNETHHTAICLDKDTVVNASHNEHGGATGGTPGDQLQKVPKGQKDTEGEIKIVPYYVYPNGGWDVVLRYPETPPRWHAKLTGGYVDKVGDSVKFYDGAYDNIDMIYAMLNADGWTLQAIAGVIGNMCAESGLNPWRWQMSDEDYHGHTKGYGLAQFTPAYTYYDSYGKHGGYIDDYGVGEPGFSPSLSTTSLTPGATPEDGNAQMLCVMTDKAGKWYVRPSAPQQYKVAWSDYKNITDLNTAVGTWLWCYEYPADISGTIATRMIYARAIYDYISGHSPTPPIPPQPTIRKGGLPAWLIRSVNNKNTKGVFKV